VETDKKEEEKSSDSISEDNLNLDDQISVATESIDNDHD